MHTGFTYDNTVYERALHALMTDVRVCVYPRAGGTDDIQKALNVLQYVY